MGTGPRRQARSTDREKLTEIQAGQVWGRGEKHGTSPMASPGEGAGGQAPASAGSTLPRHFRQGTEYGMILVAWEDSGTIHPRPPSWIARDGYAAGEVVRGAGGPPRGRVWKEEGVGSRLSPHTSHNAWRWPHILGGYGPKPARPSPNTMKASFCRLQRTLRDHLEKSHHVPLSPEPDVDECSPAVFSLG